MWEVDTINDQYLNTGFFELESNILDTDLCHYHIEKVGRLSGETELMVLCAIPYW